MFTKRPLPAKLRLEAFTGYLAGVVAVAACTGLSRLCSDYFQLGDLVMIQLLGVLIISIRFGVGPSLFTAGLSVVAFDFFFIPPLHQFALMDPHHFVTFGIMLSVAAVISGLNEQLRWQKERARQKAEEAQRAQLDVETERLRSSLLSALSHDLKTPVTAILGAGQMLAKGNSAVDPDTHASLVSTVIEETERLNAFVTNLLAMTRLESGTIDLRKHDEAIDEVIGSALGRLQGRPVHTEVPAEVPLIAMDAMLIEQVIINLLENAIRYTEGRSPIDIHVTNRANDVVLELSDRGPGILPEELEKVFEKFYRGKRVPKVDGGMGLGLTICRAIIAAHDGRIVAKNRMGGGNTIEFTLPRSNAQPIALDGLPDRTTGPEWKNAGAERARW